MDVVKQILKEEYNKKLEKDLPEFLRVTVVRKQCELFRLISDLYRLLKIELTSAEALYYLCLAAPPNLTTLDVAHLKLTTIPKEIGNLTKLVYLDLRANKLAELPDEISNLINLEILHLEYNKIPSTEFKKIVQLLPDTLIYFSEKLYHKPKTDRYVNKGEL